MIVHQYSLLPTRATYTPQDAVLIEIETTDDALAGTLSVWRLGVELWRGEVAGGGVHEVDVPGEGSYGIELVVAGGIVARTAVEVTSEARSRLRYGFVAAYPADKDIDAATRLARRLHVNAVQFYDWAYRHADLLGGGESYDDALGQTISLDTVRALAAGYRAVGAEAIGYAAVYAVGPNEWDRWSGLALLRGDGEPYALGDFLFIVDPAAEPWLTHFRGELARSAAEVGLDGFHLDQYGYPKFATTPDGALVDVAESFATLIGGVREELPQARLIFNNVNDFPTWRTASLDQDAVYIEPWEPNDSLASLAALALRARAEGGGRPVVLAAYQHVYDSVEPAQGDISTALTMATLFSHGATQLLAGEDGRLLVDPYYVRNQAASEGTLDLLTRWYDFLVEHDALLMPAHVREVTSSYVGGYNGDLDVRFEGVAVASTATAGAVWRRVTTAEVGLVVHLINLVDQTDTAWDAARNQPMPLAGGRLRMRSLRDRVPRVSVADPDGSARLVPVEVHVHGDEAFVDLPALNIWQVIHVVF